MNSQLKTYDDHYDKLDTKLSYWPHDLSHEPTLKIGEVIALLEAEFPLLAASKVRYYENINLVTPYRTPTNQRLFSRAQVERLRFILAEQRDRYMTLGQIKEMLAQLDRGEVAREHPGKMRALEGEEKCTARPNTRLQKAELAALLGVSLAQVEEYVEAGLLHTDARGRLTAQAVDIVRYASMLENAGIDVRHLKAIRNSAHMHCAALLNVSATNLGQKNPLAKERALAQTAELTAMATNFYRALLVEKIEVDLR